MARCLILPYVLVVVVRLLVGALFLHVIRIRTG